ncbi:MAG: CHASE domain-containing protein, partial [Mesorhizobium sp.]|nr:CHASE domain-containing protein [Mesorhizobium sp.]
AQNDAALGFDMFSEPVRRAAMTEAMQSGQPRASGKVTLVQSSTGQGMPGFLIYLPLSLTVTPNAEPAERAAATVGFIYAPFRAGDLFTAALVRPPLLPLSVEVHDGAQSADSLLFRSKTAPDTSFGAPSPSVREMTVAGRKWVLNFRPTAAFVYPMSRAAAVALGLFGLLLAAALALLVRSGEKAYAAINALHAASERSLQDKDLMLQEMKHRIKNSITRVLAISRQTAAGATSIEEFSASFGARLQAMAASQDMLTRSRWQKADLRELLETELAQVFGQNMERGEIDGPGVEIDERTTQALGLTFHELATNALKYGAGGDAGQSLSVTWKIVGSAERSLVLLWTERGAGRVDPPTRKGFGTRLIEANIVRELGGAIDRSYPDDGLDIRITIPLRG